MKKEYIKADFTKDLGEPLNAEETAAVLEIINREQTLRRMIFNDRLARLIATIVCAVLCLAAFCCGFSGFFVPDKAAGSSRINTVTPWLYVYSIGGPISAVLYSIAALHRAVKNIRYSDRFCIAKGKVISLTAEKFENPKMHKTSPEYIYADIAVSDDSMVSRINVTGLDVKNGDSLTVVRFPYTDNEYCIGTKIPEPLKKSTHFWLCADPILIAIPAVFIFFSALSVYVSQGYNTTSDNNRLLFEQTPVINSEQQLRNALESTPAVYVLTDMELSGKSRFLDEAKEKILYAEYTFDNVSGDNSASVYRAEKLRLFGDIMLENTGEYTVKDMPHSCKHKPESDQIMGIIVSPEQAEFFTQTIRYMPDKSNVMFMAIVGNGKISPYGTYTFLPSSEKARLLSYYDMFATGKFVPSEDTADFVRISFIISGILSAFAVSIAVIRFIVIKKEKLSCKTAK